VHKTSRNCQRNCNPKINDSMIVCNLTLNRRCISAMHVGRSHASHSLDGSFYPRRIPASRTKRSPISPFQPPERKYQHHNIQEIRYVKGMFKIHGICTTFTDTCRKLNRHCPSHRRRYGCKIKSDLAVVTLHGMPCI
jgi:hypothetical protein